MPACKTRAPKKPSATNAAIGFYAGSGRILSVMKSGITNSPYALLQPAQGHLPAFRANLRRIAQKTKAKGRG